MITVVQSSANFDHLTPIEGWNFFVVQSQCASSSNSVNWDEVAQKWTFWKTTDVLQRETRDFSQKIREKKGTLAQCGRMVRWSNMSFFRVICNKKIILIIYKAF